MDGKWAEKMSRIECHRLTEHSEVKIVGTFLRIHTHDQIPSRNISLDDDDNVIVALSLPCVYFWTYEFCACCDAASNENANPLRIYERQAQ